MKDWKHYLVPLYELLKKQLAVIDPEAVILAKLNDADVVTVFLLFLH